MADFNAEFLELSAVAAVEPDVTPPVVTFTPGSAALIARDDAILIEAADDVALAFLFAGVDYGVSGAWEAIHDGATFTPLYSGSTIEYIDAANTKITVVRGGGWPQSMRLRVYASDSAGNLTTASASYTVSGLSYVALDDTQDPCAPRSISHNTSHVIEGVSRLIEQYRGKPRMEAWVTSYLTQIQQLEDVVWQMLVERTIAGAVGWQLDVIGVIVGRKRLGLADAVYRTALRAQIRANNSDGVPEDLIDVLRIMATDAAQQPPAIELDEGYPASITIALVTDIGNVSPPLVFEMLNQARGHGVRLNFVYTFVPKAETFIFGGAATGDTVSTVRGLGNAAGTTGGKLAGAIGP